MPDDEVWLRPEDVLALTACLNCHRCRSVPDTFGDYVLCDDCYVMPRDPFV